MGISLNKYFRVLITIIMVIVYLPIVNYRLPAFIGSIHLWFVVFAVSVIVAYPKILTQRLFIIFLCYFLLMLFMRFMFWEGMDEWYSLNYFWGDLYAIFQGILIYLYFKVSRDYDGWAKVTLYTLVFLVITAIMTIVFIFVLGGTERLSYFADEFVSAQLRRFGSGNYSTMVVFMSLLGILVYYFKTNLLSLKFNKNFIGFLIVLFLMAIVRFQIFTNFVFAVVLLILCFINAKKRKRVIFLVSLILCVLYLIPKYIYVDILFFLVDLFEGYLDEISFKFREFANLLLYGATEVDESNAVMGRFARFPILRDQFLEHPILGYLSLPSQEVELIEKKHVYHLYWMSKLSACGLPMFLFNIYILYYFLKNEYKYVNKNYYYFFLLSELAFLLYGVPKVIAGRETWIFFFVIAPGMYYLPLLNKKRNKNFKNVNI